MMTKTEPEILSVGEGNSEGLAARERLSSYNLPIGSLRAFLVLLVVAHHAFLAYHPFAPAPPASLVTQPRWWQAFPVVDSQRSNLVALFVGFNDIFFMSLLFLVSGLFVWSSLERKGTGRFLRDRLLRLGLPYLAAIAILSPAAYYPTYLQMHAGHGLAGFWEQWAVLGAWPPGPVWFVAVLLVFDCCAALFFRFLRSASLQVSSVLFGVSQHPARFFCLLVVLSAAAYISLDLKFGPLYWSAFGPFAFQTSRILHYGVYFLMGVALGAYSTREGLLASDGRLARRWPGWVTAAFLFFGAATGVSIAAMQKPGSPLLGILHGLTFACSCAASSFAFLAIFLRFVKVPRPAWDNLRENSYGIYLVHNFIVSWVLYCLLPLRAPALVKGTLAFLIAAMISWIASAGLRRVPAIRRIV